MAQQTLIEKFFETLIAGDRQSARKVVEEATETYGRPEALVTELFWPTYELVQRLFKEHQIEVLNHNMATRLLRWLVDQNSARLRRSPNLNRSIFCMCGPAEGEELGAQMAVDMLEAAGFDVTFAGGNVANDEVLGQVQESKPNVLLIFSSAATDLPNIRALIDTMREIGACHSVQIAVGGGVFNRADGLAEEIGADIWASTPLEMVETLVEHPRQRAKADQRTVGRMKKPVARAKAA